MRVGNDIKRSKTLSSARTLSSEGMVLTGKATTAKKATLNNEKAKIFIDAASFAYNVGELSRLQNLIVEYSQVCIYIVMLAKYRG